MKEEIKGHVLLDLFREARWINAERVRGYSRLLCACYLVVFVGWLVLRPGGIRATLHPVGADFPKCWAASSLALHGHPASVYDHPTIEAAEKAAVGDKDPGFEMFDYPPTFLAMVLPLSLLPYEGALIAWTLAGLAAYLFVVWKIAPCRETPWIALAFPAALLTILDGQNGFFTVACSAADFFCCSDAPCLQARCWGSSVTSRNSAFCCLSPFWYRANGEPPPVRRS